jgi:hypothetical protein
LEQLVELTKKYYVEKKARQLADKLDKLSEKQDKLAENEKKTLLKNRKRLTLISKIQEELKDLKIMAS